MTVAEAIAALQKMPDKSLEIYIELYVDCPHCGHSNEFRKLVQVVLAGS